MILLYCTQKTQNLSLFQAEIAERCSKWSLCLVCKSAELRFISRRIRRTLPEMILLDSPQKTQNLSLFPA